MPSLLPSPTVTAAIAALVLGAAFPARAQQNPSELYASAKQYAPRADPDCRGTVENYLDALKYLYAFTKVAEFNGTFSVSQPFHSQVLKSLGDVEDNARSCLNVGRIAAQFRSDGPVTPLPPASPPSVPDSPIDLGSTGNRSDAEVEQWRQRAVSLEAALLESQQRAANAEQSSRFWLDRVHTLVGTWEMNLGPQKGLISFTSVMGRWSCAEIDSLSAKTKDIPCAVRRDPDAIRVTFPNPGNDANLTLQFNGPDQMVGTVQTTNAAGAVTSRQVGVYLNRKQ